MAEPHGSAVGAADVGPCLPRQRQHVVDQILMVVCFTSGVEPDHRWHMVRPELFIGCPAELFDGANYVPGDLVRGEVAMSTVMSGQGDSADAEARFGHAEPHPGGSEPRQQRTMTGPNQVPVGQRVRGRRAHVRGELALRFLGDRAVERDVEAEPVFAFEDLGELQQRRGLPSACAGADEQRFARSEQVVDV